MQGVRREHKNPGEYRTSQNWIGGSRPSNAVIALSDLEKFINNEEINTPDLIKIAMIHYQFESIHPFLDGNGRTGRILIPIYLLSKGHISQDDNIYELQEILNLGKDVYGGYTL